MKAPHHRISDPEVLREMIDLQAQDIRRLMAQLSRKTAEIATLKGQSLPEELQAQVEALNAQLSSLRRAHFGDSSERLTKEKTHAEAVKTEKRPRRGHGPRNQPALPIVDITHDLDEPDKTCPSCGLTLTPMGEQTQTTEQVDVIERKYVLVRHHRKVYRCSCQSCVEVAEAPSPLIKGGRYTPAFGAHVAVSKFDDHLPLERQVKMMARSGLNVTSTTLFEQLVAIAKYAEPTVSALKAYLLEQSCLHVDETRWKLLSKGKSKTWWAWVLSNHRAAIFELKATRGADGAADILQGYRGNLIADGYKAYTSLDKRNRKDGEASFTLAHCWAHVRRKFFEARHNFPDETKVFLDTIAQLYQVEREAKVLAKAQDPEGDPGRHALLKERHRLRAEKSADLVDAFFHTLCHTSALPRSGLGKAIAYAYEREAGLRVFLDHDDVEMDNNPVERAIRGPAVGRKNFYGTASKRGAWVTSVMYSIIETAKLSGVDPTRWLLAIIDAAKRGPEAVVLPWELQQA